jgi:hypothetical protein
MAEFRLSPWPFEVQLHGQAATRTIVRLDAEWTVAQATRHCMSILKVVAVCWFLFCLFNMRFLLVDWFMLCQGADEHHHVERSLFVVSRADKARRSSDMQERVRASSLSKASSSATNPAPPSALAVSFVGDMCFTIAQLKDLFVVVVCVL